MATHELSWRHIAACLLAVFLLAGCEGDDGAMGATGAAGADGTDGVDGAAGPPGPPGPGADPIAAAIESSKVESCATCHGGIGEGHQALYDEYVDESALTLTLNSVSSEPGAVMGEFDVTLDFSITKDGMPFVDAAGLPSLGQKRFYAVQYDSATGLYLNGNQRLRETNVVPGAMPGDYTLTQTGIPFAPEAPVAPFDGSHVYGYIAEGVLLEHEGGTGAEIPQGSHVHLYDNVANAALAFGTAAAGPEGNGAVYDSLANVSGCEKCHGTPYLKHGFRAAEVDGLPDFAACKSCHYEDRAGRHTDWQYMVDDPVGWATAATTTADYSYTATVMNDTHMSHAMEFPYPQSMSNCSTCHEGRLPEVLDNSNFTAELCQSCHPVQGLDAWPGEDYAQPHRAPALDYLWQRNLDLTFHDVEAFPDCTGCHGVGEVPALDGYHTGYDVNIANAMGQKYSELYTVSIESATRSDDTLTVNFTSSDPAIVPELLVSFYGWDTKHFIVGSHERDSNPECTGFRPGCKMEYTPESSGGSANPLFTEDAASVPGNWIVTLDMAALQLTKTADIPTLIADGVISKAEIGVTPELELDGIDVVLMAVGETFDLETGMFVDNYFKGDNSTVEVEKCNVCHDALASTFHSESGRGGDGIEVCKHCHTTTFPGSHIEMASRAIDSYTHAIHSFQDFDVGDTFEIFDPVLAKRYDQHTHHVFPNFTIRNCEACHRDGTYDVPDQTQSMPGVLSQSDTVAAWYMIDDVDGSPTEDLALEDMSGRNIGGVPELVTGPASRACGGCHRARLIRDDVAGDLVSLNAHAEAAGTLVENDDDDAVLFGVIDKIMSLFE